MSHKEIMEAYRSMQELDEKKLSNDQKKEMDVDDDNDIDGDDLKKLRSKKKGKDEKDDEMEVRIESAEELEELSKDALKTYVKAAKKDYKHNTKSAKRHTKAGDEASGWNKSEKSYAKAKTKSATAAKRVSGIANAKDKIYAKSRNEANEAIDYAREKNSAASKAVQQMWQDALDIEESKQTAGATAPEKIDSKMSPMSKAFVAMHGMKVDNSVYPSQKTAVSAGRATSQAPARRGDKR